MKKKHFKILTCDPTKTRIYSFVTRDQLHRKGRSEILSQSQVFCDLRLAYRFFEVGHSKRHLLDRGGGTKECINK